MHLVDPQPAEWQQRFEVHRARLLSALCAADVQHIGSTALSGIRAKDVVDILVGVPVAEIQDVTQRLVELGYVQEGGREGHAWLCWPAPEKREAVVHVMERGGEAWRKRLYFRDFLRENPAVAREYEALKLEIAARADDWGEYTAQKAAFVERIVSGAF